MTTILSFPISKIILLKREIADTIGNDPTTVAKEIRLHQNGTAR